MPYFWETAQELAFFKSKPFISSMKKRSLNHGISPFLTPHSCMIGNDADSLHSQFPLTSWQQHNNKWMMPFPFRSKLLRYFYFSNSKSEYKGFLGKPCPLRSIFPLTPCMAIIIRNTTANKELCGHYLANVVRHMAEDCNFGFDNLVKWPPCCRPMS